jgi:hypothetical protein
MLIKEPDDHSAELAELERLGQSGDAQEAKRANEELRNRRAGLKGEQESTYHINFHFAPSKAWAVIHDLRLEHGGRVAQIDHLVMNRAMEIYVLESKHFHAGLKITDQGEFMRWNDFKRTFEGMASPLEQNERHIAVLKDVLKTLDLPTRVGLRIMPSVQSFVLVSPNSRIDRPKHFDTSQVIKADVIKKTILDKINDATTAAALVSMAKFVSSETVMDVAEQLARQHRPVARKPSYSNAKSTPNSAQTTPDAAPASTTLPPTDTTAANEADPSCKKCHGTQGSILYGKYGYYFQCATCQENTSIRFTCQPGHKPKLRKARDQFYRECPECGTSTLYFTNPSST